MGDKPLVSSDQIYDWEGWAFNIACALYILFLSHFIRDNAIAVMKEGATVPWLGVLVIVVSLLEMYAFPKKIRHVHYAVKSHGGEVPMGFLLWMFHAVISIILVMMAYAAFGGSLGSGTDGEGEMSGWMVVVFCVVVIKELYFLFTMMGMEEGLPPKKYARPNKREWLLDLILLAYACIAYSVTWETISHGMDMEKNNTVMYIVNVGVSSLLFLMFYMPLRIPYYLEELAHLKTDKDYLLFAASVLIVLVPVIRGLG